MRLITLFVLATALHGRVAAQAKHPVTLDWAMNDSGKLYPSLWTAWIRRHDLLMLDESQGGFQTLDPATGRKEPVGNAKAMRASLKSAGGPDLKSLSPPAALDEGGMSMAFQFDNGVYILNASSGAFVKATGIPLQAQQLRFSPDGKSLGYVVANDLYVYDLDSRSVQRLTTDGSKSVLNGVLTWVYWEEIYNHHEQAYWWSPDSQYVAFFHTDESGVPLSEVVDFRQQYPQFVSQCYPKPGNANPIVKLGVVRASGGPIAWIDPLAQEDGYVVGVKWLGPDLFYESMNRAQTKVEVVRYTPSDGSSKTLLTDRAPKYMDVSTDFSLIDGNRSILFGSGRSGYEHLYRQDLGTSEARPITQGDWQVLPAQTFDPAAVQYIRHGRSGGPDTIYFAANKDSFLEKELYRVDSDGRGLIRVSKEPGSHEPEFSPDGQFYVDRFSNRDTPPTVNLDSADGKVLQTLAKPNLAVLNAVVLSKTEYLSIPARDGFKLPAAIRKPVKMDTGKRYPAIIEIYGGPEAPTVTNSWDYSWAQDQLYNDAGFIVLHVDNRSSTLISQKLAADVKGRFYGASERDDFVDAARWLKSQPDVDPDRIGITGWSGGGGNTLNCMCRSTEFKAGIAGAPYLDPAFYDTFYSEHLFGLPKEDPKAYEDASIWRDAKNLHGKLLLMWGTGDDNVHPQHELKFIDECIKAGKLVQVMIYPMRKHGFGDDAAEKHRMMTFLQFWKDNL